MKLFRWIKSPGKNKLPYLAANLQGIGARKSQEDSFAFANVFDAEQIEKNGLLFVVADGMGGMRDGKIASDTAVYSIKNDFENTFRESREITADFFSEISYFDKFFGKILKLFSCIM